MTISQAYKCIEALLAEAKCFAEHLPDGADPANFIFWPEHVFDRDPDGCPIIPDCYIGMDLEEGSVKENLEGIFSHQVAFWFMFKPKACPARERACGLMECADCFICELCDLWKMRHPGLEIDTVTLDRWVYADPDADQTNTHDGFRLTLSIS